MVRRQNDGFYWNIVFGGITLVIIVIVGFIMFAKMQTGS